MLATLIFWEGILKAVSKVIFIFLFFSVLIASCAPVTAVPTVTPTFTVTPYPTITPTLEVAVEEQEAIPTQIWKNLPPSQLVNQYKLVPWSPKFYETMTDLLDRVNEKYYPYLYHQSNDFRAAFASEAWLHAGSEMDENSLLCDVRYFAPNAEYFTKLRPGQDLFSFSVENLLNKEGVSIDSLPQKFRDLFGRPECLFGFSLDVAGNVYFEPVYIHNLFGDGQEAYVFAVGTVFTDNKRKLNLLV